MVGASEPGGSFSGCRPPERHRANRAWCLRRPNLSSAPPHKCFLCRLESLAAGCLIPHLMVRSFRWNGRKPYEAGSSRERHDIRCAAEHGLQGVEPAGVVPALVDAEIGTRRFDPVMRFARPFDQRREDTVDAPVGELDQDHITRLALDLRRDLAVTRPGNEIAFPMTGHGTIFDRRRPFADRYRVLHLARPVSGWRAANGGSFFALKCSRNSFFRTPHARTNRLLYHCVRLHRHLISGGEFREVRPPALNGRV